jgi:hypothetical protein
MTRPSTTTNNPPFPLKPQNSDRIRHPSAHLTELQRAVNDRHEWRTPVLANLWAQTARHKHALWCSGRRSSHGQLQIYTDSRSPKVADMTVSMPGVMLTFWSKVGPAAQGAGNRPGAAPAQRSMPS